MTDAKTTPSRLVQERDGSFTVEWKDGAHATYSGFDLRVACPCAQCKDEFTGERKVRPENVSRAIRVDEAKLVGNYALSFVFSDGHRTGVYSFEFLRWLLAA